MASFINFQPILLVFCGPKTNTEIIPGLGAPPALVLQLAPPYHSFARRAAGLPIQKLEDVAVHVVGVDGLLERTHFTARGGARCVALLLQRTHFLAWPGQQTFRALLDCVYWLNPVLQWRVGRVGCPGLPGDCFWGPNARAICGSAPNLIKGPVVWRAVEPFRTRCTCLPDRGGASNLKTSGVRH